MKKTNTGCTINNCYGKQTEDASKITDLVDVAEVEEMATDEGPEEEEERVDLEQLQPDLFREEINLDAVVKTIGEIVYNKEYPTPYLDGIGRWYVFYRVFIENNIIEDKKGKQKMFIEFIDKVFEWKHTTRRFSSVVPSFILKFSTTEWKIDNYIVLANHLKQTFFEFRQGRRELKSCYLKEGKYINTNRR